MDDMKNFILDKAKVRFNRFGYKKTTMDELSRDCQISKRTIYVHFNDKEHLFTNLMSREFYKASQVFAGIPAISGPQEKLVHLIKKATAFFNEDNFLVRLFNDSDETHFSAYMRRKYASMMIAEIMSITSAIISEGKNQGKFRDIDEKVVAFAGVRLFQNFSYMDFPQGTVKQDYYADVLADFIVNAVIKK